MAVKFNSKFKMPKRAPISRPKFEGAMSLTDMGKRALDNIKSVGADGRYLESAIKGAAAWGAVGGVTEWAQGGSFWEGAQSNLLTGAMAGAGSKAVRVGAYGSQFQDNNFGSALKKVHRKGTSGFVSPDGAYKAAKTMNYQNKSGVSKQVVALQRLSNDNKRAYTSMYVK